MEEWQEQYWNLRLEQCKKALEKNHFEVFIARSCIEAGIVFRKNILPDLNVKTVSWGDSITLHATGILEDLKNQENIEIIETFAKGVAREVLIERRRQALLVDLFFTGSNAITETGKLVNLDMVGNRVGGITFGPKHVVLLIGRNKLVQDVESAMARIKSYAAPLNAIKHEGWKTPCRKTSYCMDCSSPDRICNTWVINEKCYPEKRIKIILINQDCGL